VKYIKKNQKIKIMPYHLFFRLDLTEPVHTQHDRVWS